MLRKLRLTLPIIQAPMAGVSTPALAAAVSNAGGLGSISIGAANSAQARAMIEELRALTPRAFNVNVFAHKPPKSDAKKEAAWLEWLAPLFAEFNAQPPRQLREIYRSFLSDSEQLHLLLELRPAVVSFHFGLPAEAVLTALKNAGITLFATATSVNEAKQAEAAGIDAIVAQGIEAGGHRGVFDPSAPDDQLGILPLTRLLISQTHLPVIAAGGMMDGKGIAAALNLGAVAAQLGTAFIACPESAADAAYRKALAGPNAYHTRLTKLISGRLARSLANRFTKLQEDPRIPQPPAYPIAYDAGKALHIVAKTYGEHGFAAHWAGQGAPLTRPLPAAELMAILASELQAARLAAFQTRST